MVSFEYFAGLILGLSLLLIWTASAGGQQLVLDNLVLDNVRERIQLRFGIQPEDVDLVQDSLEKGGGLRMQCTVVLRRQRGWWPDSTVVTKELSYDLKANPLLQTYTIRPGGSNSTVKDSDLQELLSRKCSEITMDLGPWQELQAGSTYILELTLQFKRPDAPQWLKNALFFWSWDVVSSQTYRMHFNY